MRTLLLKVLCLLILSVPAFAAEENESAYERVMRTGTIRCGYYLWPPLIVRDPNTGELHGGGVDLFEAIGKALSLKLSWQEEVDPGTMFEGYKTGRYDILCAPVAPTPARARVADFTKPLFFGQYRAFVRKEDSRFDDNIAAINDPEVRYALLEGEYGSILRDELFPESVRVALPQMAMPADLLNLVATGKADVAVTDPVQFLLFDRNNPEKLRQAHGGPVRVMPIGYSTPPGEERLKNMLDITIDTLHSTGVIDRILKQHPDYDNTLLRVAKPYEAPQ